MRIVNQNASLEMLDSLRVVSDFEVGKAKVVVQLCIVRIDLLGLFKRSNGQHIFILFVHANTVVEECLPRAGVVLLEMSPCHLLKAHPILGVQHADAQLLEGDLLL